VSAALKIGKKLISPKKAKDAKGAQGVFLTEKEWKTVLSELKVKASSTKKESILSGALTALEEVEVSLKRKKKLRNANEAISEL
jgi:hypothetical protein